MQLPLLDVLRKPIEIKLFPINLTNYCKLYASYYVMGYLLFLIVGFAPFVVIRTTQRTLTDAVSSPYPGGIHETT